MKLGICSLLALPALLSALVVAIPSPSPPPPISQRPLVSTLDPHKSRWRSFSDSLIESIWQMRWSNAEETRHLRPQPKIEAHAPPHTRARYGGDVVLRFHIRTVEEAERLAEAADTLLLDIWDFTHDWVDIRLREDVVSSLLGLLPASLQASHKPLLRERELAQAIYDTYPAPHDERTSSSPNTPPSHFLNHPVNPSLQPATGAETNIFFTEYQPLSVIDPWMRLLASLFTTHVRKISLGLSYEGREIPALRIGVHPTTPDSPKRKTVLVMGGLHAREWIGTSTVNYVAYSLITAYGREASVTRLLQDFDFVFVPTLNPDGYVYTWETDRLWRKNRQATNLRFCRGIDLDRAWGFEWDGMRTAGNPCSESFAGEEAFEAIESRRLAEWAKNETENNNVEFVGFLDLHSYSQEILYPYSYSCDSRPPGQENLEELALGLAKAIRISSALSYEVMAACEGNVAFTDDEEDSQRSLLPLIEGSGGSALDWFFHELRVRFAYQIKLRDRGTYGFLLPKEDIIPTGKEVLSAVMHLGQFLQEVYVNGEEEAEERSGVEEMEATSGTSDATVGEMEVEGEDWVIVEDLMEPQWELRRRRRK